MRVLQRVMSFFAIVFFVLVLAILSDAKLSSKGTGICLKTTSTSTPVTVSKVKQIMHRYYKPCIAVPPLCTRYKMIYATVYETEYVLKNETTAVCCNGFQEQNEICEPVCADGCGAGVCSAPETCTCHAGWTGPKCSSPVCKENCVFGECVAPDSCKCRQGWSGNQCNDAICSEGCKHGICAHPEICGCENGWYGKSCDLAVCTKGCGHGECVEPDICKCNPGWSGNQCNDAVCSQGCKHGTCVHLETCRCEDGWNGVACDKAVCTERCHHGACSLPDLCECETGWEGKTCNEIERANCTTACDHGMCVANETCKCEDGWIGKTCNETCPEGFFGSDCSQKCDCDNSNGCDPKFGQCYCLDGFLGNRCSERCPLGTYGRNCEKMCSCENGGKCNHVDGSCECSEGFEGVHCQDKCQAGFYGHNCSNECSCNKSTSECHHTNGFCKCFEGWIGKACDQRVESSTWRSSCSNTTCQVKCRNGLCDVVSGECICESERNQTKSSKHVLQDNVGVTAAIGGSVTFLLIVIIILSVFILWRRKKKKAVPKKISEATESLFPGRTSKLESESDALKDTWNVTTRGKNLYEKAKRESLAEMMAKEKQSSYFDDFSSNIYEDIIYKPVNLHPEDNVYENDGVRLNAQHNLTYGVPTLGTPTLPMKNENDIDLHELVEYSESAEEEDMASVMETYDTPKNLSSRAKNKNSESHEEI